MIFPEELKKFIIDNNAASPAKDCIELNGIERVYAETLSFNEEEKYSTNFFSVAKTLDDNNVIPFASDPFGNYFCYLLNSGTVSFYNHEEDKYEKSQMKFKDFIDALY